MHPLWMPIVLVCALAASEIKNWKIGGKVLGASISLRRSIVGLGWMHTTASINNVQQTDSTRESALVGCLSL